MWREIDMKAMALAAAFLVLTGTALFAQNPGLDARRRAQEKEQNAAVQHQVDDMQGGHKVVKGEPKRQQVVRMFLDLAPEDQKWAMAEIGRKKAERAKKEQDAKRKAAK